MNPLITRATNKKTLESVFKKKIPANLKLIGLTHVEQCQAMTWKIFEELIFKMVQLLLLCFAYFIALETLHDSWWVTL